VDLAVARRFCDRPPVAERAAQQSQPDILALPVHIGGTDFDEPSTMVIPHPATIRLRRAANAIASVP
jgi:hypothetical protein